MTFLSATNYY